MAVDYQIERTEIDGVPVFWTPSEGPRQAALMFRVGRGDEAPHQCGITHLVEHLALAPLTQQAYEHNGFVEALRTVFVASGSDDQLMAFVNAVVSSLRALPFERTLMERRILMQEASGRHTSSAHMLRWLRCGDRGAGLVAAPEAGLDWLGPQPIEAWASSWFTAENAALWWNGPPPDGLRLDLPHGVRKPTADTPRIPALTLPARNDTNGPGTGVGFVVPRTAASWLLVNILQFRLHVDDHDRRKKGSSARLGDRAGCAQGSPRDGSGRRDLDRA